MNRVVPKRIFLHQSRAEAFTNLCLSNVSLHVIDGGGITRTNIGTGLLGGDGSVEATCGGSLLAGEKGRVIRWCEEMEAGKTERRRGYVCGAAWDEGNIIQAMARLKNPTIAWRYGDG